MSPKGKLYLFAGIFLIISLSYLSLQLLFPHSSLAQLAHLFPSTWLNYIAVIISYLFVAIGLSGLIEFSRKRFVRMRWRRTKIGEILVSEGYLTVRELKDALSEQKLKIGEVLLGAGRITSQQLAQALRYQKKFSKRLGEILRELGYVTEEDISWALRRMNRKLGEIVREKGLLTNHEFHLAWSLQHYGPRI
jgi:hypothetical protein